MSRRREDGPRRCSSPLDTAVLADYWLAELEPEQEAAVEAHLLACDACGARFSEVMTLADSIRGLARQGCLRMIVSDAMLARAAEEGLRVREYVVPSGGSVQCTVTAEDDILVARLLVDLAGARRVDLCLCDENGAERSRLPDIPVAAAAGSVIYQESIEFAKNLPTVTSRLRLVSVDDAGRDQTLGEYTFNHTRSLPGSGGA